ncbi:putative defense protein 3 [Hylaeus anthracinus]|uniref:putative defense protein 3 n=1 Tax=Hylaeus volcanicus TaxID=313075 RepID=UPI0023B7CE46|nr:putative defense protein 3 [Hylaeus volcanicus]XP_053998441.1 putative defense protein 3 [Hylaeus anthracinus]XP_053998442.1 putative defense protein 3 [Hylaeus anthracinus]XP_053998443.1 putative defense protein 3 [Hylaeus anthracinus]
MSLTMRNIAISILVVASSAFFAYSFPDGAPVDTCVKPGRANEPNHGQARSQPPEKSPYKFTASSSHYGPGSQITVTISGSRFKGFFLQARDPDTDSWIGSWAQTENTTTHPECSAVTHADPNSKLFATLIWNAPPNSRGRVYFTGTILKEYATYWSGLVADVHQR